ncbi:unnamed protein product (macronuclear) [Paramecium tetraurelia]|uniref:DNA mismatch repair proteins mutS family domain-containing protein n=1 Tax=Paramecium tetraurelia TaxID=5888 RepID=A0DJA9_PARTE|nr:uncharacterized protein GSPATT00017470001 [Paramecium tetraurelia]CAK83126.1 unnamed protein product [Paramecium tetraurelia]|eukprot:XP_001450523.1 hypothetical protein (macronuclear) [Paramecium tetraurelia strain d4-2]
MLEGKLIFLMNLKSQYHLEIFFRGQVKIDELVTLTSTFLRYLIQKIKPKIVFATHYHILLDEFALCEKLNKVG